MDNCKRITRLVSEGLDRDLGVMERLRIRIHLLVCNACANFEKQMHVLRTLARSLVDHRDDGRRK